MKTKNLIKLVLLYALAVTILTLCMLVGMVGTKVNAQEISNNVNYSDFEYSKEQVEALNHLNKLRREMQLPEVQLDPFLTKAAENHAKYVEADGVSGHIEEKGKKHFTGERPLDRVKAVGGEFSSTREGVSYRGKGGIVGTIDAFLGTAYHRTPLVMEELTYVGFARSGEAVCIVYYSGGDSTKTVVYPYENQTGVGVHFDGNEEPRPLDRHNAKTSGFIISFDAQYSIDTDKIDAKITDSKGNNVPYYSHWSYQWFFFPKEDLKYNETYTVSINYVPRTGEYRGQTLNKTWSFTTMKDPSSKPSQPKPTEPKKDLAPPSGSIPAITPKFNQNNVGVSINGQITNLTPPAVIVNGSTFIPLRGVFEKIGVKVKWEADQQSVLLQKDKTEIRVYIGSKKAYVDGKEVLLSTAPFIRNGSTYVPLRFASEALGAEVKWDQFNYIATINTK